jgi:hypothetical protein
MKSSSFFHSLFYIISVAWAVEIPPLHSISARPANELWDALGIYKTPPTVRSKDIKGYKNH